MFCALILAITIAVLAAPVASAAEGSMDLYRNSGYDSDIETWYLAVDCDYSGYSHSVGTYWWFSTGNEASSGRVNGNVPPHCNYFGVQSQNGAWAWKCISPRDPGFSWFGSGYNDNIQRYAVIRNDRCALY